MQYYLEIDYDKNGLESIRKQKINEREVYEIIDESGLIGLVEEKWVKHYIANIKNAKIENKQICLL